MSNSTVTISSIHVYPIKGCRGSSIQAADVTTQGLAGDRVFTVMLDGHRTNQKQLADLKYLGATWQGQHLQLEYPGMSSLTFDATVGQPAGTESFRGGELPLLDMGNEVAGWLSAAMGTEVRLVRQAEVNPFVIPLPEFDGVHGAAQDRFMDAAPLLLANEASLADLNNRLDQPVPMDRFRPNIVVSGLEAFAEEQVASYEFSSAALRSVTVCERCIVTTMDQASGEMGKEPLRTLSSYRKRSNDYAGGIMFGMYMTAAEGLRLSVGDVAKVTTGQPFTAQPV